MENCRRAGFNTVLFQVRGNGTVLYRSRIEPWSEEFAGRDPGFDPLAIACREAHKRGLSLHAWVNVIPGWRGKGPPTNPKQLYRSHPDWFWRDANGRRQPFGWYNSVNPCYPEVRQYLVSVMHEIVKNYPVDGLHMDYIRFSNDWADSYKPLASVPDYPRDPRTLSLFRQATGKTPSSSPAAWNQWRTDQITRLVRDIRTMTRRVAPRVQRSAAVGASPIDAKRRHFQDSRRWIAEGLVDAVYPMNYAKNPKTFEQRLRMWQPIQSQFPVVMGVMLADRAELAAFNQLMHVQRTGRHSAVFAYNALFERFDKSGRPRQDSQSATRTRLRQRLFANGRARQASRGPGG